MKRNNAALESSLTVTDGIDKGLRLAGALDQFWSSRSHSVEGFHWLEKILAASGARARGSDARAKALYAAATIACDQGRYTTARKLLEESARLCKQFGDQRGLGYALLRLSKVAESTGDDLEAHALSHQCITLFRQVGDKWSLAFALASPPQLFVVPRSDGTAERMCLQESLALFEELGDRWSIAQPLYSLAWLMYRLGNYAESRSYYERCLPIARELGNEWVLAVAYTILGEMAAVEGDDIRAESLCEESLVRWRKRGVKWFMAWTLLDLVTWRINSATK